MSKYKRLRQGRSLGWLLGLVLLLASLPAPAAAAPVYSGDPAPPAAVASPAAAAPRAPLDTPQTIVNETYSTWYLNSGMLYWAYFCYGGEFTWQGYIKRLPVNGGTQRQLATVDAGHCVTYGQMVSDGDGVYYWNDAGGHIDYRPSGSPYDPATVLITPAVGRRPTGDRMATDANYIYWLTASTNELLRVRKDGTDFGVVANVGAGGQDLLVVGNTVYWLETSGLWKTTLDCGALPCSKTLLSVHSGDGLMHLYRPGSFSGGHFFPGSDQVYWAAGNTIRRYSCSILVITCSDQVIYTAPSDGNPWREGRPATDGTYLFWKEGYFQLGGSADGRLRRMDLSNTASVVDIAINMLYSTPPVFVDSNYVYFDNGGLSSNQIARLPVNASAIVRDLKADKFEVTQAIQDTANLAPLAAGKPTYVRGYGLELSGPSANAVNAYLYGTRGGSPLPGSPLHPINGVRSLQTGVGYDRAQPNAGWLFQLPDSWISAGTVNMQLVVDPGHSYPDPNTGNNAVASNINFQSQPPECTVFMPVRTHDPLPTVNDPNFWDMVDRFARRWPIPATWSYLQSDPVEELETCWWGPFPYPCYGPYELDEGWGITNGPPDKDKAMISIMARAIFSDDPDECQNVGASIHYMGMVNPNANTGSTAGYANLYVNASWVKLPPHSPNPFPNTWNSMFAASVMDQELTHNFNRGHVNCGNPSGIDSGYPYPPCQLDNAGPDNYYGFDIASLTPIAPTAAADFMSYASNTWVSDYTWRALFNAFMAAAQAKASSAAPAGAQGVAAASPQTPAASTVMASGFIDTVNNQGRLSYLKALPNSALSAGIAGKWRSLQAAQVAAQVNAAGATDHTYHLQLIDPNGTVLDDRAVTLQPQDQHDPETHGQVFILSFPAPDGQVKKAQLMDGTTVLDTLAPGLNPPQISILLPAGGETIDSAMTIQWSASDPDKDPLLYTVQYSYDSGGHWQAIATDMPGTPPGPVTTLALNDLGSLHGSNGPTALVRVIASDGYHTAVATSAPFTLANRKPTAYIVSPNAAQSLPPQDVVTLHGGGNDAEDGGLSGARLTWDVNGASVGQGTDATVAGLAPGSYPVTLTAHDSLSQTGVATSTLNLAPLSIPLAAGGPIMDGLCDDGAYAQGVSVNLNPYGNGDQATVHLIRDSSGLWACFSGLKKGAVNPGAFAGLRVDVDHSQDALAQLTDYGFFVGEDGGHFTYAGDGAGNFAASGPGGLQAQIAADQNGTTWNAELRVDAAVLGGWDHMVGMNFGHYWVGSQGDDYMWPYASVWNKPNTWATTALGLQPRLTSIDPGQAKVGDPDLTLVVGGEDFDASALVLWNGAVLSPTVSGGSSVLTATVPAALLTAAGAFPVTVRNPNNLSSNALPFVVDNQAPAISALNPAQSTAGGNSFTLTVDGSHFVNGAKVAWNGVELPTTFVSGVQLTAQVDGSLLGVGETASVTVQNPAPQAAGSNPMAFTVLPGAVPPGGAHIYLPAVRK